MSEIGSQRAEGGGQRSEVRGRRSEDRDQRSEVRGRRAEGRSRRAEVYESFENCRDCGLKDQVTMSALSVPSNISEGFDRPPEKARMSAGPQASL